VSFFVARRNNDLSRLVNEPHLLVDLYPSQSFAETVRPSTKLWLDNDRFPDLVDIAPVAGHVNARHAFGKTAFGYEQT